MRAIVFFVSIVRTSKEKNRMDSRYIDNLHPVRTHRQTVIDVEKEDIEDKVNKCTLLSNAKRANGNIQIDVANVCECK